MMEERMERTKEGRVKKTVNESRSEGGKKAIKEIRKYQKKEVDRKGSTEGRGGGKRKGEEE